MSHVSVDFLPSNLGPVAAAQMGKDRDQDVLHYIPWRA